MPELGPTTAVSAISPMLLATALSACGPEVIEAGTDTGAGTSATETADDTTGVPGTAGATTASTSSDPSAGESGTAGGSDGPGTTGDASTTGALETSTGETGGLCGQDPAPSAQPCPGECASCGDGVCALVCDDANACVGKTLTCPDGWDCTVSCTGTNACVGAAVDCPAEHACTVVCSGTNACTSTAIGCGEGVCELQCKDACTNAVLTCGPDECTATCTGAAMPDVECGPSCQCTPC